ncbi:hypothetical protein V496_01706 [Pseudogymnoascus sp. VKM F-4515 (FW-2607)]|nr:hypothetical protein V496_01706 [Pseudogymnoascus sp. VKM F-4515 (FW-2607)]
MVAILPEDGRRNSVELLLPDNQGMAYEEVNSFGSSAITGWKFCKDLDGKIQCIEKHGCDPQEDGVHKVRNAYHTLCRACAGHLGPPATSATQGVYRYGNGHAAQLPASTIFFRSGSKGTKLLSMPLLL